MARMKVLINGGGIAGNALAFWLSKLGHEVTVVERFPSLRATGLQLDLRGHGVEVLKRMGLEQAFRAKSIPEQGMQVVDSAGRQKAYFPVNRSSKGVQSLTSQYEIMRGDLTRLLHDACKSRVKYVFGTSIESFQEKDSSIEARFTDGQTDRYDLLVGADGQNSRTRKLMLGSETEDGFQPLGTTYIGYFTIPRPMKEGEDYLVTWYIAPGSRFVMTRRHSPQQIQAYLTWKSNSERLETPGREHDSEVKEAIAEVFQGAGWETDDIVKSLKEADDFYYERMGIVKLDSWSRGRATLVGDAAHAPSTETGMGTTSAMVGAYILAGEIGRHYGQPHGKDDKDGLATALKAYEQKFQPFMKQVQQGVSEDRIWNFLPSSPFAISVMNRLLGAMSYMKVNIFSWGLKETIKDWELPEYKELLRD